jgi:hypothetical protein
VIGLLIFLAMGLASVMSYQRSHRLLMAPGPLESLD